MQPGEFVVTTFWRRDSGIEEMHVYTGCGTGDTGLLNALKLRDEIITDYRVNHPVGPRPVVKVVKTTHVEGELWNQAQTQSSQEQSPSCETQRLEAHT